MNRWKAFIASEDGPSTVEYALLLALLLLTSVATLGEYGGRVYNIYEIISSALK